MCPLFALTLVHAETNAIIRDRPYVVSYLPYLGLGLAVDGEERTVIDVVAETEPDTLHDGREVWHAKVTVAPR